MAEMQGRLEPSGGPVSMNPTGTQNSALLRRLGGGQDACLSGRDSKAAFTPNFGSKAACPGSGMAAAGQGGQRDMDLVVPDDSGWSSLCRTGWQSSYGKTGFPVRILYAATGEKGIKGLSDR